MFCSKCGAQIEGSESVCPQCQGAVAAANQAPVNINSHMVLAIIVTVLCCLPFGIVSIIYAAKVSGLVAAGRIDEAMVASNNAKKWGIIGLVCGLIGSVIGVIIQVVAIAGAAAAGGGGY